MLTLCSTCTPAALSGVSQPLRFSASIRTANVISDRGTSMLLYGIFPPITTPFYPDGNVYFKKLESNVERYSRTTVAGIVVLGSTGEAILLSDQERRDVLKSARAATAPNKV